MVVCSSPDCGQFTSKTKAVPITEVSALATASPVISGTTPSSVGHSSQASAGAADSPVISCTVPRLLGIHHKCLLEPLLHP